MRVLVTAVLLLASCEHRLPIGSLLPSDSGPGGSDRDAASSSDADAPAPDAGLQDVCERKGPLVEVGDGKNPNCNADSPRRAFRYAVCTCESFQSSSTTELDAFDSRDGPFVSGEQGGSMGANQSVYPAGLKVGGNVDIAGPDGMPLMADIEIAGDLSDQGQLDGTPYRASIGGDARVGGALHLAALSVGGTLTVASDSDVAIGDGAPPFTREAIDVAPPCDCAPELDIKALIAQAAQNNDNGAIDLDPAEGLRSLNAPIERGLPCGTYYVDAFYAPQPITLTITGHVALFIKGSMVAEQAGDVRVQVVAGGELDLFVENGISTKRLLELGTSDAAGRVRVYAGGSGSLSFEGETTVAGSLYAPRASLVSSEAFTAYGAVHVRAISSSAPFIVHYDRALADDDC